MFLIYIHIQAQSLLFLSLLSYPSLLVLDAPYFLAIDLNPLRALALGFHIYLTNPYGD